MVGLGAARERLAQHRLDLLVAVVGRDARGRVRESRDQARDDWPAPTVVEQDDLLAAALRARQRVADLEADTEAGPRGLGDDQVGRVQPRQIALVDLPIGEACFRGLDALLDEMRGQYQVCPSEVRQLRMRRARASRLRSPRTVQAR